MKKSFVRRTVAFFIAICLIPFFVFTLVFVDKTGDIENDRVKESLITIAEEKAAALEKDMKNIENETVNLAQWAAFFVGQKYDVDNLSDEYGRNNQNIFERAGGVSAGKSNVYLPNNMELTPVLKGEVINTEKMEAPMASVIKENPDVSYAYMVTENGLLRVYPYLDNNTFAPDHDQRSDYFYTRAVGKENPSRNAVWTNPYYDYGGNGWIITCSSPFYIDGKLGGVVCLDVSLKKIAKNIADFRIGKSGFAFVISQNGDVIYHPEMMDIISQKGDRFKIDLEDNENAINEYRWNMENMMAGKTEVNSYIDDKGGTKIVAYAPIKTLNWSMGIEVAKSEYSVGTDYLTFGFWSLIAALLAACLFMASTLSRRITGPIKALTSDVQRMADGQFGQVSITTDDEIGLLGQAYNRMSKEISEYTASLLHRKNQLETVFNSIGGVMLLIAPDFTIRMINQKGVEALSLSENTPLENKKCYELFRNENEPCKNCPVVQTLRGKVVFRGDVIQDQNILHTSSYPIYGDNGEINEIVVYSRNITEQIMLEREFMQSEKMAGVGQLVAGVTHELKNPLATIKGAVYLIRAQRSDEARQEQTLSEISNSVSRAERIVNNMLSFSKTSNNEKELVNLKELLEQILLLVRQDMVKRKIKVEMTIEDEPLYIYGNGDSFKHIFLNLVTNAIDAMPLGGNLKIAAGKIAEGMTEIILSNDGEPIADENFKKIFQPFFTTKEKGTGLGLWIVNKEVSRNGGTIEASNCGLTQMRIVLSGKDTANETNIDD